jgi:hypothetical protein
VSDAIIMRINKAYVDKKPFKVVVILPLLPGF